MCLGIPMKVVKITGDMAQVESHGLRKDINIAMLPQVKKGDYVIVHAGFAIEKVDPRNARETLRIIRDEIHR